MGAWRVRIAGVTFSNPDGSSRQAILRDCRAGEPVTLQREWGNEHDPNAIAVHVDRGQIGYVPAGVAAKLAKIGFGRDGAIVGLRGGTEGAPTVGAEILIEAGRRTP